MFRCHECRTCPSIYVAQGTSNRRCLDPFWYSGPWPVPFSHPPARNMDTDEGVGANPDHIGWGIGALDVAPSKKSWRCEDDGDAATKTRRRSIGESASPDELPANETVAQTLRHEEVLYAPDWPRKQLPEYSDDPWLNPEYHHSLSGIDPHSPFKHQNFMVQCVVCTFHVGWGKGQICASCGEHMCTQHSLRCPVEGCRALLCDHCREPERHACTGMNFDYEWKPSEESRSKCPCGARWSGPRCLCTFPHRWKEERLDEQECHACKSWWWFGVLCPDCEKWTCQFCVNKHGKCPRCEQGSRPVQISSLSVLRKPLPEDGSDPNRTRYVDFKRTRPVAVCPRCRVVASLSDFRRWNSEALASLDIRLQHSNYIMRPIVCNCCLDFSRKKDREAARVGNTPISQEQWRVFHKKANSTPKWNWTPPIRGSVDYSLSHEPDQNLIDT